MAGATELTRAGSSSRATALIRSMLHRKADRDDPSDATASDTIEGSFTRVDGTETEPQTAVGPTLRKARKGLAETLRGISAGGMPPRGAWAPVPVDLPAGAQFLSMTHTGPQGRRDYRL